MALILNLETSTTVCSVNLSKNGKIIARKETNEKNSHSSLLTIFIEDIFKENIVKLSDIDAVAISKGPGSYTGLRIGVSTAKGIAYGADKKLIAVNTLQSMAWGMRQNLIRNNIQTANNTLFCPMIDARRMEVYTAFYDKNIDTVKDISAEIIDENSFNNLLENNIIYFFGDGSNKCKNTITHKNAIFIDNIFPSADFMIPFSENSFNNNNFEDIAYFEPFYLKDFIATVPKKNIFS